jgi:hypothetical protein
MSDYYILKDKEVVMVPDMTEWAEKFENENRRVGADDVGDHFISTVFLGIDHNFSGDGPPLVFETMVFKHGEWSELDMKRYSTWDEAETGHKEMVEKWRNPQ